MDGEVFWSWPNGSSLGGLDELWVVLDRGWKVSNGIPEWLLRLEVALSSVIRADKRLSSNGE